MSVFLYYVISFPGTVEEAVERSLEVHKQVASLGDDFMVHIRQIHQPGSHPPHTQKSMCACCYVMSLSGQRK